MLFTCRNFMLRDFTWKKHFCSRKWWWGGWRPCTPPLFFSTALHVYNKKDFGLYRDGGLEVAKNNRRLETEKVKKNIQKISKENKLDIVIQCNMKIVNNLDVSLNLNNSNYKPYHNPDNKIIYIHKY